MRHDAAENSRGVTGAGLVLRVVVVDDTLVSLLDVVLAAVVRPVLYEGELLAVLVALGAVGRKVEVVTLAVVVVKGVRVTVLASRLSNLLQGHAALRSKVQVFVTVRVFAWNGWGQKMHQRDVREPPLCRWNLSKPEQAARGE